MINLEYSVAGQLISATSVPQYLVADTVGIYRVVFTFDSDWSGLGEKTAVFRNPSVIDVELRDVPVEFPLDENNSALIPGAILDPGKLFIGVYGVNGTQQMPTIWAPPMQVVPGASPGVDAPDDPAIGTAVRTAPQTLTEAEQAQARENIGAIGGVEGDEGNVVVIGSNNNISDSGISKDNLILAPQLASNNVKTDAIPYVYRQTGGGIGVGNREYDSIVGGSVIWNQLLRIMGSDRTQTVKNVTLTDNRDGSYTLNGTASASGAIAFPNNSSYYAKVPIGHIFAVLGYKNAHGTPDNTNFFGFAGVRVDKGAGGIWKNTTSYSSLTYRIDFENGVAFNNVVIRPMAFDLTQMFGSTVAERIYAMETASEGSGIAILKRMLPNAYYPYNAGELMSVSGLQSHKTVGFNLFDKSNYPVYNGYINFSKDGTNGVMTYNSSHRTLWIPCLPNTSYSLTRIRTVSNERFGVGWSVEVPNTSNVPVYNCYQATRSGTVGNTMTIGTVTGANAKYLVIWLCWTDSNIPQAVDTLCVNISDPTRNGTYEPYTEHTYPLDSSLTLRGVAILDDNNNIKFDGDIYAPDGTVTRRYGIVDLGTLTWQTRTTGSTNLVVSASLPTAYQGINSESNHPNMLAEKYMINGSSTAALLGQVVDSGVVGIYAYKTTSTTTTIYAIVPIGTTPTGKFLYNIATASTETAEPYESLQICDPLGTEEYVTTGICPVGHETRYPENQVAKLDGLPSDFSRIIAPTEKAYKATRTYTVGRLLIVNNILYKVISAISSGATLTVGTNISETTLDEVIASL